MRTFLYEEKNDLRQLSDKRKRVIKKRYGMILALVFEVIFGMVIFSVLVYPPSHYLVN